MPRIYVQFYNPKIVRNKRRYSATIKVNVFVSGFLHQSILLKFSTQQFIAYSVSFRNHLFPEFSMYFDISGMMI